MHRSRHSVADEDNEGDDSPRQFIPSTTGDYSSLIVESPSDTMFHRTRSPSPSPTSSIASNNPLQGPQPSSSSSTANTSLRATHRRFSHSSSALDTSAAGQNAHRDRLRFNTWPRHRKERRDILAEYDKRLAKSVIQELGIGINKTYRNPWGNLSYAQLITRAIDSSPWKRLTLNEVYEWIIKFVPYFKDKIDAKTSWGWKNSIRHNLSLHNQFIRVPIISSISKGPVKYVWTINPSFKNNSPYKKYSLKRKRAAAAAALASQTAAAVAAVSNVNPTSSPTTLALAQDRNSPTSTSSQPLVNMSNNYHRQPSASATSLPKAARLNEHPQGSTSSTLNQLSVAAAMMSAGVTDPAAYRAFLNSQAAAMLNKHKQQALSSPATTTQQPSPITHRPTQSSSSFAHDTGLPVPKKVALGVDRFKQQQHQQQQQQQHAEWLLSSYRQQQQQQSPYNGRHPHAAVPSKMMVNQQRAPYLAHPPSSSTARVNPDMANLPPALQRRVGSPPGYSSAAAVAAQNKLLAQTKLWHAAVQAAAHAQQQYHHHHPQPPQPPPPPPPGPNAMNELQNYINRSSSSSNGNHTKVPTYLNPETLKLLSSSSSSSPSSSAATVAAAAAVLAGNNPHEEQHSYRNDPRYKLMRASYPNAASSALPPTCLIRQKISPNASSALTPQQQIDMVTAAYHNYRRRSSGFSSTTSHGGPSDDEVDEYVAPRKDSSTSNASSGYESGLPHSRLSPSLPPSIRTGSGSSIASELSTSPRYNNNTNNAKFAAKRLPKLPAHDIDLDMDERQQLSLGSVGGYVDDLMERIRKMPPKKRSKFYQMLDEERLKDVNNNNEEVRGKSKSSEPDEDDNGHPMSMDVSMPMVVSEVQSDDDDDDRTLIDLPPNGGNVNLDEDDDDHEEIKNKFKQQEHLMGLTEKSYEELRTMGVPIAVLKAIAFQQHQQAQPHSSANSPLSNFLSSKYPLSTSGSPADTKSLLNARTILRRILQQHQKEQQQQGNINKALVEAMDYTTDEEGGLLEDDDDEPQSSIVTPCHRNGVRSNSHNPGAVSLNPNDISSLSPPTSTSSSPDETDVNQHASPTSISRPSSTPAALISSGCSF